MSGRLDGKVAIVFGAGSVGEGWGNGKATAMTFARAGATVVCVDINPAAAETVAIITGEGNRAEPASCDVLDGAVVHALDGRPRNARCRCSQARRALSCRCCLPARHFGRRRGRGRRWAPKT